MENEKDRSFTIEIDLVGPSPDEIERFDISESIYFNTYTNDIEKGVPGSVFAINVIFKTKAAMEACKKRSKEESQIVVKDLNEKIKMQRRPN